ncbi:hypothetical protein Tcan_01112, partial [Toxocara canis]
MRKRGWSPRSTLSLHYYYMVAMMVHCAPTVRLPCGSMLCTKQVQSRGKGSGREKDKWRMRDSRDKAGIVVLTRKPMRPRREQTFYASDFAIRIGERSQNTLNRLESHLQHR